MAKVLIYSPNLIGKSMAGPAIRAWEFAKALANSSSGGPYFPRTAGNSSGSI